MTLKEVRLQNVRNIATARIQLHPQLSIVSGPNGGGKTSFLESLYMLGAGHSFRSRDISSIIRNGENQLTVFSRFEDGTPLSIQKSLHKPTLVKYNQSYCSSNSQLAHLLPIQVFHQGIFNILDAGPSVRRALIDWGLFHVRREYGGLLNDYKKILRQRNALLKRRAPQKDFTIWDKQLTELADEIHRLRHNFLSDWLQAFGDILPNFTQVKCQISYYKGWDKKNEGLELADMLARYFASDSQRGYTQYGPHQADLVIESIEQKAKHVLSRGQQKMILFALKVAQATLINKPCLFLIDDFAAELDYEHQEKLLAYINTHAHQTVITMPDADLPKNLEKFNQYTKICVKQGRFE